MCWFINPIWQISPNSYVKQLTHLVLYPPNSPKVDCWSSHIQWKKPKICYVKKKDRTRGNLPDGRAAPRLCRASPPQRNPIPGVKSSGFSSFPPKVNENHHLDGVPHLDPLGSGQVKPMANPGWLFFRTVDYAAECCTCCRFYSNRILPISTKLMVSRTVVLPGATWWRKSLRLPFRFVPAVNHHLSFTAKTGWFQYQTHPILIRDSLRVNKILTD